MVRNKAGREYYYLTLHRGTDRQCKSVRLPDNPASHEFWQAYAVAMSLPPVVARTDTVKALDDAWERSPEWAALASSTKIEWKRHRGRIIAAWGSLQVKGIEPKHVLALRDQWASTPATANNMLRCLSSMLGWSVPRGWRPDNPCRDVPKLRGGDGYSPWPWAVIEAAREELRAKGRHDLWEAVALALYTGQRLGDCLAMRWSAYSGGAISVVQSKTGKALTIPTHAHLRAILDCMERRAVTILTSSSGHPWAGFQASWRKHRPELVASHGLVFHGLRKSAVVMLLEAGATEAEVASVTGQSLAMVAHYAKQVSQSKLAATAILKWERAGT